MDKDEAEHIQKKVRSGDVIGINKVIYAAGDELTNLSAIWNLTNLKKREA